MLKYKYIVKLSFSVNPKYHLNGCRLTLEIENTIVKCVQKVSSMVTN